jgi:DNA helicase-2/ATP-dependent DNA helicase PcrA
MSDPFDLDQFESPAAPAAPTAPPPFVHALNEAQREAVLAVDGPVLVLAGAGTGKTRVLTTRLAHILASGRARPGQILAVTFTNKAAREMRDRVAELIGGAVEGLAWLGTFHSVCARILRFHAELVGLKANFTILDADDQLRLIKQLIREANIDDKRWPPRLLASHIDRWKNRALAPDKVPAGEAFAFADGAGARLYAAYQARLAELNAVDFGDLIALCIRLFTEQPEVLAQFHRRFAYILVDEYQDTNVAQYLWLRLLAQKRRNICCVGDDDQSIYGWRGAEVGNILRFESDFPGARIIRLERNYRSTPEILAAASGLIAANDSRLGKSLWTEAGAGEKIAVRGVWDGAEEARVIGDEIEALQRAGIINADIAVLVRVSAQMREIEERFITLGLPYRVVGGPRFYERLETRDAIAYLNVIHQPAHDLAFERIINKPKRGLGEATVRALHVLARGQRMPLTRAAEMLVETDELRPQTRARLRALLAQFAGWREIATSLPPAELAQQVLEDSGYLDMWRQEKTADAQGRVDNLAELVRALGEFETLEAFLEHISLVMENAEADSADKISLMTLHGAKGLEFRAVFLPGWEEGLFPSQRALDEGGNAALEEERRLAYVGLTRAKQKVMILHTASRQIHGQWQSPIPSRFIAELPAETLEQQTIHGFSSGLREPAAALFRTPARHIEAEPAPDSPAWRPGMRVFHQKFGYGLIREVEGSKLHIAFDAAGDKRVLASFVEPA